MKARARMKKVMTNLLEWLNILPKPQDVNTDLADERDKMTARAQAVRAEHQKMLNAQARVIQRKYTK